jgi:hypothetical protein
MVVQDVPVSRMNLISYIFGELCLAFLTYAFLLGYLK